MYLARVDLGLLSCNAHERHKENPSAGFEIKSLEEVLRDQIIILI